jgi:hypothetical protein
LLHSQTKSVPGTNQCRTISINGFPGQLACYPSPVGCNACGCNFVHSQQACCSAASANIQVKADQDARYFFAALLGVGGALFCPSSLPLLPPAAALSPPAISAGAAPPPSAVSAADTSPTERGEAPIIWDMKFASALPLAFLDPPLDPPGGRFTRFFHSAATYSNQFKSACKSNHNRKLPSNSRWPCMCCDSTRLRKLLRT